MATCRWRWKGTWHGWSFIGRRITFSTGTDRRFGGRLRDARREPVPRAAPGVGRQIVLRRGGFYKAARRGGELASGSSGGLYEQAVRLFCREAGGGGYSGRSNRRRPRPGVGRRFSCCTPEPRFAANFVKLGLHPGFGLTYTLPRLIGNQRASLLFYTGAASARKPSNGDWAISWRSLTVCERSPGSCAGNGGSCAAGGPIDTGNPAPRPGGRGPSDVGA